MTVRLRLRADDGEAGEWASLSLDPGARQTVFLAAPAAQETLLVEIEAVEASMPKRLRADVKRLVGVGVTEVMLCRADDLEARVDFLERHGFQALEAGAEAAAEAPGGG